MRLALALLAVLLLAPAAAAGSADAPEMVDAMGDAGPNQIAAPAGHGDVDIVAAWFENEGPLSVDLVVLTTEPIGATPRPFTQWTQAFDVAGGSFFAGFADFGPNFRGPFLCKSVEGSLECDPADGGLEANMIRVVLPFERLGNVSGEAITITGGRTFGIVFVPMVAAQSIEYDVTPPGLPYVLRGALPVDVEPSANATLQGGLAPTAQGGSHEGHTEGQNETPSPGALLALAAVGAALIAARRRLRA